MIFYSFYSRASNSIYPLVWQSAGVSVPHQLRLRLALAGGCRVALSFFLTYEKVFSLFQLNFARTREQISRIPLFDLVPIIHSYIHKVSLLI